ncbi:hypothetical protein [Streptomyces sp. NBC_00582]|uniref:hypothetical protein n=1 Tax=Streptomyces sp. NBC_00582 TaxID=2975783 RepID=UPI002E8062B8|nr:hypothetical protein [Streptomyces sp. NBC_00582]WUB67455.1 hypothetical protein OG852_47220 [Streptomyces sp. NBC_00582]
MSTVQGVDPVTGTRPLSNAREWLHAHLDARSHPFHAISIDDARAVVDALPGIGPEEWAEAWLATGRTFESRALDAQSQGWPADAREAWRQAYQFAFVGRCPSPLHPAGQFAYRKAWRYFLQAGALDTPPVERIEVPIGDGGREGNDRVVLSRPAGHGDGLGRVTSGARLGRCRDWKAGRPVRRRRGTAQPGQPRTTLACRPDHRL